MGTQIQSETFSLQSYSKRDINLIMSSGIWSLRDEEKGVKSSQHRDSLMASRPLMGGYLGHDKQKVRETIMKHEILFRHQVQELHRLYRRQRNLMYEMKMNELHKLQKKTERTWHGSYFFSPDSMLGKLSPSNISDKQSPATVMEGKNFLSRFSSQNMWNLEKLDLKSSNNMFHVKPLELEIPADVDMNDKEAITRERLCGLAGNAVDCKSRTRELLEDRDLKPSLDDVLKCHSNAGDLICDTRLKGRNHLADLNEPIPLVGTSVSCFMTNSGGMLCPAENVQKWDLTTSANSSFGMLHPMTAIHGKTGPNNLLKDRGMIGKEQMIYGFKTGVSSGDSPPEFESVHVEHKPVHRNKRKIFGVEILEEDDEPSLVSSSVTHVNHQPDQLQTNPSSITSRGVTPDHLRKKVISSQENHDVRTSESLSCLKGESHLQNFNFVGRAVPDDSHTKNFPSSINKVPSQNSFHVHHEWKFNLVNGSSSSGFDCLNGRNAVNLVADQLALHDPLSASSQSKALPWFMVKPQHNGEKARWRENPYSMNLDFVQKCSLHLFKKTEVTQKSSQTTNLKQEPKLSTTTGDAQNKKVNCIDSKKIFGFHIPEMVSKTNGIDPSDCVSETSCSDDSKFRNQPDARPSVLEKGLTNYISSLRNHIDLNFSMNEEEIPSAPTLPAAVVKIATTEIDLEVPAVLESEVSASEAYHRESEPFPDESNRNHELIRIAAESLVSISSALAKDFADCGISQPLEATSADSLKWFAELISSHESDQGYKIRKVSGGIDSSKDEGSIPDGMDYFEFMTLKLKDVKEESYCFNVPCTDNQDDEEPAVTKVQKRPRRGQGRRGRHTKDFQRDVLPSLVSLSKQEVVEDLHTIEQLLRASGGTWQSSLSRRSSAKNGRARMYAGGSPPTLEKGSTSLSPVMQTLSKDQGLGDTGLTGWGKRTRRLPRKRNSRNNHVIPSKC